LPYTIHGELKIVIQEAEAGRLSPLWQTTNEVKRQTERRVRRKGKYNDEQLATIPLQVVI